MSPTTRNIALIVAFIAIGAGAGAVFVKRQQAPTPTATPPTPAPNGSTSFWKEVPPGEWKNALMEPQKHRNPAVYSFEDADILVGNLDTIALMLEDPSLPVESRYQLGNATYSLASIKIALKNRPIDQLDDQERKILKTAIAGLRTRYTIANTVNPLDGLQSVYLGAILVSPQKNPEAACQILKANGWDVPEQVIRDAFKSMQAS